METVTKILKYVRASKHTYRNLSYESKVDFRRLYTYLKAHKNKEVCSFAILRAKKELSNAQHNEFVRKFNAMNLLCEGLKH